MGRSQAAGGPALLGPAPRRLPDPARGIAGDPGAERCRQEHAHAGAGRDPRAGRGIRHVERAGVVPADPGCRVRDGDLRSREHLPHRRLHGHPPPGHAGAEPVDHRVRGPRRVHRRARADLLHGDARAARFRHRHGDRPGHPPARRGARDGRRGVPRPEPPAHPGDGRPCQGHRAGDARSHDGHRVLQPRAPDGVRAGRLRGHAAGHCRLLPGARPGAQAEARGGGARAGCRGASPAAVLPPAAVPPPTVAPPPAVLDQPAS